MRSSSLIFCLSALLLVACGSAGPGPEQPVLGTPGTLTMNFTIQTQDPQRRLDVMSAATRTMKRRLEALGVPVEDIGVQVNDSSVELKGPTEALNRLKTQLLQPFSFVFMHDAPLEGAEIVIGGIKGFNSTTLNETHVDWLTAQEGADGKSGTVSVAFTAAGKAEKKKVFEQYKGQDLGVFVLKRPVYKFTVESADIASDGFEIKIPQGGIAEIFADDMNMSRYIEFHSS